MLGTVPSFTSTPSDHAPCHLSAALDPAPTIRPVIISRLDGCTPSSLSDAGSGLDAEA